MAGRKDAANSIEGIAASELISLGMSTKNKLINGKTFTKKTLSGAGTVTLNLYKLGNTGAVTDLCVNGDFVTTQSEEVPLTINKKVSGLVGGCFLTSGIVPEGVDKQQVKFVGQGMNALLTDKVFNEGFTAGSAIVDMSTIEVGQDISILDQIDELIAAYKTATSFDPTTLLLPSNVFSKLRQEWRKAGFYNNPSVASEQFRGVPDMIEFSGVEIYEYSGLPTGAFSNGSAMIYDAEALFMVEPRKTTEIAGMNVNLGEDNFKNGIIYMDKNDSDKGIMETAIHKWFGVGAVARAIVTVDIKAV